MKNSKYKNIYVQLTKQIKIEVSELIYIIAFGVYISYSMLRTTMIRELIPGGIAKFVNLICIVLITFKVLCFDKYSLKKIILMAIVFTMLIISAGSSGYHYLIFLSFLIIGANDVSFRRIVKVYFFITLGITILAFIASQMGIIENIVYYRGGKARYAFGSIYCTDFAARVFYIILSYIYLKGLKITNLNIIIFIILGCFVNYFSDARLDSLSIFSVCIFLVYIRFKAKYSPKCEIMISKLFKLIIIVSVPICAIIATWMTYIYDSSNYFLNQINKLLSHRLAYGKKGITEYGFKLFGQQVAMNGSGATSQVVSNYFFIDSSYIYIALRYGVIVLLIFCIFFTVLNKKMIKKNEIFIPIVIMFIAINSMIAHHFIDIVYNVFILGFFSRIDTNIKKKEKDYYLKFNY